MIKRLALLLLLAVPASAAVPGPYHFGATCKGGGGAFCYQVPLAPTRFYNFMTGSIPSGFNYSRGSAANYFNSSGVLTSAAINTPRFDYGSPGSNTLQGLLIEGGATNLLLWNRDLTQTAWTQVTATVLLDQTGIDNAATSASSFTALGSNSTVCQTVTQAATNDTFSVYLKRISGTGAVAFSQDGGASYTTITLSGSWQRFQHANQSVLNPTVCIRLATNGDEIAMDYAQLEASAGANSFSTSPILSTSSQGTRSQDNLSMPITSPSGTTDATGLWYNPNSGAFVAEWELPYNNFIAQSAFFGLGVNLFSNPRMGVSLNGGNIEVPVDGVTCDNTTFHGANFIFKTGATYSRNFFQSACNNVLHSIGNGNLAAATSLSIMVPSYVRKFTYWNYPLTAAQIQAQTL